MSVMDGHPTAVVIFTIIATNVVTAQPTGATRVTDISGVFMVAESVEEGQHFHYEYLQVDSQFSALGYLLSVENEAVLHARLNHQIPNPGHDHITISDAVVADGSIWIGGSARITVQAGGGRHRTRRANPLGTRTVLGVRITSDGGPQNIPTAAAMSDMLFATSGATFTMKSQFNTCSSGALQVSPAADNGSGPGEVVDGVLELAIAGQTTAGFSSAVSAVRSAAATALGLTGSTDVEDLYDIIMIFQPGTSFAGTAFVNGQYSRYRAQATTHVSTHMHELGHNFGLGHSNENGVEYGDGTGCMGSALITSNISGPAQCFNHAKNHQLGWFPTQFTELSTCTDPTTPTTHRLISPQDAGVGGANDKIYVRITMGNPLDYYVGFNLDERSNGGTREGQNDVTVQSRPPGTSFSFSDLDAELANGQSYTQAFTGPFTVLVTSINLLATPPFADISISCSNPPPPPNAIFAVASGSCNINADGTCFYDSDPIGNYFDGESCTITVLQDATLTSPLFNTVSGDVLTIGGTGFAGTSPGGIAGLDVTPATAISWVATNGGIDSVGPGFEICATAAGTQSPTTSSPTPSPTDSPTTSSPTPAPTGSPTTSSPTPAPTASPTTSSPTVAPTDSPTTSSPTTAPTDSPTTSSPTVSPTEAPSDSPTTTPPTTQSPTVSPTDSPTTSAPTVSPTDAPSDSPTTTPPTNSPTTSAPTQAPTDSPTTSAPTSSPTTSSPTLAPTDSPTTSAPTDSPTTSAPTGSPTTSSPTPAPTDSPTTSSPTPAPTDSPTTSAPTGSPTTSSPTPAPTDSPTTSSPTPAPTDSPTTSAPTDSPTTSSPTASPTTSPTASPTEDSVVNPSTVTCGGTFTYCISRRWEKWTPTLQMPVSGRHTVELHTCGHTGNLSDTRIFSPCSNNNNQRACRAIGLGNLGTQPSRQSHCETRTSYDAGSSVRLRIGAQWIRTGCAELTIRCNLVTPPPTASPIVPPPPPPGVTGPNSVSCGDSVEYCINRPFARYRPTLTIPSTGRHRVMLHTCGHTGTLTDTRIFGTCRNDDNRRGCRAIGYRNVGTRPRLQSLCVTRTYAPNQVIRLSIGGYWRRTGCATINVVCGLVGGNGAQPASSLPAESSDEETQLEGEKSFDDDDFPDDPKSVSTVLAVVAMVAVVVVAAGMIAVRRRLRLGAGANSAKDVELEHSPSVTATNYAFVEPDAPKHFYPAESKDSAVAI